MGTRLSHGKEIVFPKQSRHTYELCEAGTGVIGTLKASELAKGYTLTHPQPRSAALVWPDGIELNGQKAGGGVYWNGDRRGYVPGDLLTCARFPLTPDWAYTCLEIEDAQGRRAWTNNLFRAGEYATE